MVDGIYTNKNNKNNMNTIMAALEFVDKKEACRLWQRDLRTLQKWAEAGEIRAQRINPSRGDRPQWYFETPQARYDRLHMYN